MSTFKFIRPNNILDAGSAAFSRASTGTYFDSAGVMQTAAINVERHNYNPVTRIYSGLLLEAAATNLITYSEQFDNAAWTVFGTVVRTANTHTAPDGTLTADTLTIAAVSGIYQNRVTTPGTTYVNSVWIRGDTAQTVRFVANTDLSEVTTTTVTVTTSWQRVSLVKPTTTGVTVNLQIDTSSTGAAFQVWGAQLEAGSTATSYIPTVASAVTRAADVPANSFTRSTTATYFDAAGVLQTAAINVPRIGYDPVTHAHTGLMLEGASTNLLTYSAQFDNAAWSVGGAGTGISPVVTANQATAPDGTMTADRVVFDKGAGATSTDQSRLFNSSAVTVAGQPYAITVWMRSATSNSYLMRLDLNGQGSTDVDFPSLVTVTPTWQRFEIRVDSATDTVRWLYIRLRGTTGSSDYADVYIWGAQQESSLAATSYIPTVASQVTRAADVATGSGLIYTTVPEADYPAWVGGTTYTALTSFVIRTTTTTHKIYQCLVTHTTAATPETNLTGVSPKWLEVSPTNRWGMFDQKVGTTTTVATSMTYLLKPGRVNSLALLGLDASTVEVSLSVLGETVYSSSTDLDSGNTVGDWYEYFYEPIYQTDSLVITDLLSTAQFALSQYADCVLCVRFLRPTGNVTGGVLVTGAYAELGFTQYNPTVGIIDYSRKSTDDFGSTSVVARTYSKRMSCTLDVARSAVDSISRLLAQYRATPVVWVAADNLFTSLIVYGFYKDWEVKLEGYETHTCSIQIEGLT